ncbi:hypothetical protein D1AOALGA4SA_891 [Olavius algarvensis Delta 1 endosymbiont]|nr:hypothetical protein D1AOALGA4SA_891 [Olavius algarvensis Delta 1 endosymbiont]
MKAGKPGSWKASKPQLIKSYNFFSLQASSHPGIPAMCPFSCRVGCAHQIALNLTVEGGHSPPYNCIKANIEYRTRNHECRSKVFCRFKTTERRVGS